MKYLKFLPLVLLTAFCVKLLANKGTNSDVVVVVAMCALTYVLLKEDNNEAVKGLETKIEVFQTEVTEMKKLNDDVKGSLSSLKLAAGFRQVEKRN